jgi:hypothetical protein
VGSSGSLAFAACLIAVSGQTTPLIAQGSKTVASLSDGSGGLQVSEVQMMPVPDDSWEQEVMVRDDRAVNALTARTVRKNALLFVVIHRARQSFTDGRSGDFLGLDAGGLKVGLGLRFGVRDDLDIGVFRLNGTAEVFDTYELDARYRFLDRGRRPADVALRAGLSWFVHPDAGDASGAFVQLLASRRFGRRVNACTGFLYHADSSGDRKSAGDDDASVGVQGSVEVWLRSTLSLVVEAVANVGGYGEDRPAASTSLKAFTYGHTFSLVVSNTQYVGADGIVTNAWRDWDEPIIVFNITRDLRF